MDPLQRSFILTFVLASFGGLGTASTVLFSNLQPGNQLAPDGVGIGHTPAFVNPGDYVIYAVRFTPDATALLTSFEAPLTAVEAFLYTDSAGAPGSVIETFAASNFSTLGSLTPGFLSISSTAEPELFAGHQYWFGATGGPDEFDEWSLTLLPNSPSGGSAGREVIDGVAQPWTVNPGLGAGALIVLGTVVPEPSHLALFSCIFLVPGACFNRAIARRKCPRKLVE